MPFRARKYILITVLLFVFGLSVSPVLSDDTVKDLHENEKPVVAKIFIHILNAPDNITYFKDLARNVIFIKEGEPFSELLLQDSIKALKLCKQFKTIHVDSKDTGQNIELIFNLTLASFIKDIRLKGNYPFFDREILNLLTIYAGDVFDDKALTKQINLISAFFKQKGFFAPGVYIATQQDVKDGHYIITIKIAKGPYYSFKKIEITGNHSFSATRLKMKLKHFRFSFLPGMVNRFVERDFSKEIEKLAKFYRKMGFPDVSIKYFVTLDKDNEKANVHITINEGDQYRVIFEGNKEFGNRKLKKHLVIFTSGNKVNFSIRKSIRNLKTLYLKAGYIEARVRVEEDINKKEKTKQLKFIIYEGPKTSVASIGISGNKEFTTRKIKKQMLTNLPGPFKLIEKGRYAANVLADDVIAIQSMYHNRGFSKAQVDQDVHFDKTREKAKIKINISEGPKILVSSVTFKGMSAIPENMAYQVIQLKKEAPFRETLIIEDENALSALISEKGFPYVQVTGSFLINVDRVEIEYQVNEGMHVKMGQVYCTGNFHTKESVIKNEISIKSDDPFSLVEMLENQRNIQNMAIFNSTRFKTIGLKEKQDTINLFIEVEENKPYYLEFGCGFRSDTGFFGKVGAGDRNLFGMNKDGHIYYEGSQTGKRGEMGILEPRFLGTRIAADLTFDAEQEEEYNMPHSTKTYGTSLGFHRKWLKNITTGITTRLERIHYYPLVIKDRDESEEDKFTITPSITYDSRDSFIHPKKGILTTFSVDISTDEYTIFKEKIDSLYDFMKYNADVRYYLTPVKPFTLALRGKLGYLFPYNGEEWVLEDQLFYLGGTSSIRGFKENMLVYEYVYEYDDEGNPTGEVKVKAKGGLVSILGSLEARIDLGFNFELTLFMDTGKIDNTTSEMRNTFNLDKLRTSAGFGLRYHTPIGPIGVFYGKKLNPLEGEKCDEVHFALGYTF